MKNPLRKRLLPELKGELGKYLALFVMFTLFIGLISGFLVADGSMIKAYNEGFTKYNIEDGHFRTDKPLNKAQRKNITELGVTIYDLLYVEERMTNDSNMRIYPDRSEVNLVCLMEGELPTGTDEIAIDRMYADNNKLVVGDTLENEEGRIYKISGLVALPDYSCLYEKNSDTMFDAQKFGVAIVSPDTFAGYRSELLYNNYAWKYDDPPQDEKEAKDQNAEFLKEVNDIIHLKDFLARQDNLAITFTGTDMGGDRAMMMILLYMFIGIMAFVFAITSKNTILKESTVIGTLLASGYTRGELVRHYMTMPVTVTIVSALIGNILGYTSFKNFCADMYYGSYSLPTYVTVWSAEAFLLTTVIPIAIMVTINYVILSKSLRMSPLKFIRNDFTKKKKRKALPLNAHIPFFTRFQLRVIMQNMSNYLMIAVGVLFANLLLMFGLALPVILNDYSDQLQNNMLAQYQYILNYPTIDENDSKLDLLMMWMEYQNAMQTENEDAEKFSAYSLKSQEKDVIVEDITLYGVQPDSRYVKLAIPEGTVAISSAYAEKYSKDVGDTITLKETYEDDIYTFTVGQIYDYSGAIAIFMYQEDLNTTFDLGEDTFVGYFSNSEITDIAQENIGTVIDLTALTKVSRQLETSMGSMMYLVDGFAVIIFMLLIYLLSKIIIEKNAQAISMTKILGYYNGEISRLYVNATSLVVVLCMVLSIPLDNIFLDYIYWAMMRIRISGWLPYHLSLSVIIEMLVLGIGTYAIVALLEYRKIRKVPMDMALKNVE